MSISHDGLKNWNWQIPVDFNICSDYQFQSILFNDDNIAFFDFKLDNIIYINNKLSLRDSMYVKSFVLSYIKVYNPTSEKIFDDNIFLLNSLNASDLNNRVQLLTRSYLIPNVALEYYVFKKGISSIDELKSIFNVSEIILFERLKDLNIF